MLDAVAVSEQGAGRDDPPALHRDEVQGVVVAAVELIGERHALLGDEDVVAQREGGAELVRALRPADLAHPMA